MTSKKQPISFTSDSPHPQRADIREISPTELAQKADLVHVIDVREPDEYTGELGHIAGSKLVVLGTLPNKISELPKDEPIVFVCKAGGRSAQATAFALAQGFTHVFNMHGGMMAWNGFGLPVER